MSNGAHIMVSTQPQGPGDVFQNLFEEKLPQNPKLCPIYFGDLVPDRYFQVISHQKWSLIFEGRSSLGMML